LAPEARKISPLYSAAQVAALCGVDKAHVNYRISKGDLPSGRLTPTGGKREFTLAEARQWTRAYRHEKMKPGGQRAICIAVANFKGGVSKTTSAMILAQGLSLRGHRVLAIDIDPQGSLTTLHGILPEAEVSEEMTIAPLCNGTSDDITPAIRSTYWDGIDLVAAAPFLFSAEFALPARQMQEAGCQVLGRAESGPGASPRLVRRDRHRHASVAFVRDDQWPVGSRWRHRSRSAIRLGLR
jgi:chromosome partitioning protein